MAYDPLFVATFYSHFVLVTQAVPRARQFFDRICDQFTQPNFVKEHGKWKMKKGRLFAFRAQDTSQYRFHIGQWPVIEDQLQRNNIGTALYERRVMPLFQPVRIDAPLRPQWQLRDYQEPIVEYLARPSVRVTDPDEYIKTAPTYSRFVGIQTGKGKTLSALAAAAQLNTRIMVLIKPAYTEKWGKDVVSILQVETKELMSVSGSSQLKGIIELAQQGELHSKVILMSTRTHQNFFKNEDDWPGSWKELGYGCAPDQLMATLGIGVVLCDEIHQEFHANFKAMLHMHVPHLIAMSATLVHLDHFMIRMYKYAFPPEHRYQGMDYDRYIKYFPVEYGLKTTERIRTSEWGDTRYSHNAYEQSIMRYVPLFNAYKQLLYWNIEIGYIKDYLPGDRAAVYASTIQMCTELCAFLKAKYPHLSVARYVEDDPYEQVIESDIRVSTLGSSGTAIDIPGLRCVILTISVQSIQSNEQVMGRLRKLPDRDVKFYAWHAGNVPRQLEYQKQRMHLLKDKVLSTKLLIYPEAV